MKKISFISVVSILALIGGMVLMNACSKQETVVQKTNSQNKEAKIVYGKIQNFLNKVSYIKENPEYKSGEDMSIDSALWNLTAGLNLVNSNPDAGYDDFYVDSAFTSLPISAGLVNLNDLVNTYSEIEASAGTTLNEAPFNEKGTKFTFIDVKSNDGSSVLLKSTTVVGQKGTDPDGPPFDEGNDWRYGNELGMCSNPLAEGDAAGTLQDIINTRRYLHVNDEGLTVFYVNPVTLNNINADHQAFDNPNDPGTPGNPGLYDNERDYLMFYVHEDNLSGQQTLWDDFSCIEHDDMNFYYYNTSNVIYDKIPNMPQYWPQAYNKTFLHLDTLKGTNGFDNISNLEYYTHIIKKIRYAKRWVIEQ